MLLRHLLRLSQISFWWAGATAVGLAAVTWVVYAAGGTRTVFPHLFYLPIVMAAFSAGLPGGVIVGVASGLLCGPLMPLDARVLAVADAFEAMTSPRPYRPPYEEQEALRRLEAEQGAQFDLGVVAALKAVLEERGFADLARRLNMPRSLPTRAFALRGEREPG